MQSTSTTLSRPPTSERLAQDSIPRSLPLTLSRPSRCNSGGRLLSGAPSNPASLSSDAGGYLLNAPFFVDAFSALKPGGLGLLIVSDNILILETAAETLRGLIAAAGGASGVSAGGAAKGSARGVGSGGGGVGSGGGASASPTSLAFVPRTGLDGGRPRITGVAGVGAACAALVSEGLPEGFGAEGTTSHFDRLWASRAKSRRFFIHMQREKHAGA